MVVVNVPKLHARKLHALVGILAATAAFPSGCSGGDFEGCEASRTCPPKGGEAGGGTGGESGGGNDTGGNAGAGRGGNSGSGGTSGTDDGGESGTGATGGSGDDDTEAPTIVSITPGDGDVDVERDVTVTIEFSEAIDENSVTETSVVLTGPDGDVSGALGVDENVVTFTAEKKLYLLGDYTVTIDETIADLARNTLEERESVGFKVRDGRWSEPVYPFGETERRVFTQMESNTLGDVVVGTEIWPDRQDVTAGVFHAGEARWTIGQLPGATGAVLGLGIDLSRRAAVGWQGGWSAFNGSERWVDIGGVPNVSFLRVTPEGQALAVYWEASVASYASRLCDLKGGSLSAVQPMSTDVSGSVRVVSSLERLATLYVRPTTNGEELVVMWKTTSGWGTPEQVTSGTSLGYFNADSDENGNIIVVWTEGEEIWSRFYERADNAWTRPLFIVNTPPDSIPLRPDMTAGNAIVAINAFDPDPATWAAIYRPGTGWIADSVVRIDEPWTGWGVAVSIDRAGNAVAAWHSDMKFKRYVSGKGWSSTSPVMKGSVVNPFYMWGAGAPDGTVLVVANDTDGQDNRVPFAVRFE